MRLCRASIAAVALLYGGSALAQDKADKSRIDDFAVPSPIHGGGLQVEQLGQSEPEIASVPRPRERSLDVRNVVATIADEEPGASVVQLTSAEPDTGSEQLNQDKDAGNIADAAVSNTADSRPQGVTRLAGSDRCDPQLPERDLARCLQILELRAQEFSAPAPPQLSAEQSLMAGQSGYERATVRARGNSLRSATLQQPDANLDSNQELASIFLAVPASPSVQQPEENSEEAATLADVIVAITQGSPPPAPN